MCKPQEKETKGSKATSRSEGTITSSMQQHANSDSTNSTEENNTMRRRGKRVKQSSLPLRRAEGSDSSMYTRTTRVMSSLSKKHSEDTKSGGIDAILPSLGIVVILGFAIVAKMGWRYVSVIL